MMRKTASIATCLALGGGWALAPDPASDPKQAGQAQTQLVSQYGSLVEFQDVQDNRRWVSSWHSNVYCDLLNIAVSPDGRFVAIETAPCRSDGDERRFRCRVIDARTGDSNELPDQATFVSTFHWAQNGSRLVLESNDSGLHTLFQVVQVSGDPDEGPALEMFGPSYSRSGDTTVSVDARSLFWVAGHADEETALVSKDLDSGVECRIRLPGEHVRGPLRQDPVTGELYVSEGFDALQLLRVDLDRGLVEPLWAPGFTGVVDVVGGWLVASCSVEEGRTRLLALDVAAKRGEWLEDNDQLRERTVTSIVIAPDSRQVAVVALPGPLILLGRLARPDNLLTSARTPLAPLELDPDFFVLGHEQSTESWVPTELRFSPDGRWLALAHGGWEGSADGLPLSLPSALRVLDLDCGQVSVALNLDRGPEDPAGLVAGWTLGRK